MALSEKIIKLRKKNGWSQEELAGKLDVSRQSVSKWESAASMPDLDKIIKLSEIFGVSTDYLIKESADDGINQSVPGGTVEIDMESSEDRESGVHVKPGAGWGDAGKCLRGTGGADSDGPDNTAAMGGTEGVDHSCAGHGGTEYKRPGNGSFSYNENIGESGRENGGVNHSDGYGADSGYDTEYRYYPDDEVTMTLPETEYYLDLVSHTAKHIAAGVFACILSPVVLILLGGLSECNIVDMTDNMAGGIGMVVLLLIVAAAVLVFVMNGMQLKKYEYLERTPVRLDEDAFSLVISRKEDFEPLHKICISIGVVLCIVSVIPLFVAAAFDAADIVYICCVDVLLFLAGIGVFLFVWSGMIYGSFCKLLEEGEYDRRGKRANSIAERFSGIYWSAMSAIYLFISFLTGAWASTWIIWPCAGVLFGVLRNVMASRRA